MDLLVLVLALVLVLVDLFHTDFDFYVWISQGNASVVGVGDISNDENESSRTK
jgi:hypothetical protein